MPQSPRLRRGLLRWLSVSDLPVFVLDARRVVRFFNRGCEALTGWSAADVIGQTCAYATCSNPASVAAVTTRLCPPSQVLERRAVTVTAEFLHRSGAACVRTVHFFPLPSGDDGGLYVLGVCSQLDAPQAAPPQPFDAGALHQRLAALQDELHRRYGDDSLIGLTPGVRRLREQLKLCAASDAAVHVSGPPGSGREHLARMMHFRSPSPRRSFVVLDCRRLPAFELKRTLRRLLEPDADGSDDAFRPGTVYLQDVGDLPRDMQDLLVEAFTKEASGKRPFRLISSEARNLAELVRSETLISDFYYLISELTLELLPLADRRDDIPLLAQHFLEQLNQGDQRQVDGLTPDAWEQIRRYNWPGNVDELQAVLREARQRSSSHLVTASDLPFRFRTGMDAQQVGPPVAPAPVVLEELLAEVETSYIRWALAHSKDNKTAAAELLGLTRPRLYRRMEALGLIQPGSLGDAPGAQPPGSPPV